MRKGLMLVLLLVVMIMSRLGFSRVEAENFEEFSFADNSTEIYSIYDENFNLLFQKDLVVVGDGYLSDDKKYYEVVFVDDQTHKGIAKFIRDVKLPDVEISHNPKQISIERRVICMYMTHNDESYVPTDGVDSVYGNGGVRDVALAFKEALEENMIDVYFDDSLHIPHDYYA